MLVLGLKQAPKLLLAPLANKAQSHSQRSLRLLLSILRLGLLGQRVWIHEVSEALGVAKDSVYKGFGEKTSCNKRPPNWMGSRECWPQLTCPPSRKLAAFRAFNNNASLNCQETRQEKSLRHQYPILQIDMQAKRGPFQDYCLLYRAFCGLPFELGRVQLKKSRRWRRLSSLVGPGIDKKASTMDVRASPATLQLPERPEVIFIGRAQSLRGVV